MQKSRCLKTLICGGEVSLAVLDTTAIVNEAIARHMLSAVAAAALGRTLTAAVYLCSWLKEEKSSLSVTLDGGGPGGKISVSGDGALNVRGRVGAPRLVLPPRADGKLDVGGFVGKTGSLTVIRDDGAGVPFVGTCPLLSGEVAEDFSAYFLTSEQRPTAVALGVLVSNICLGAGGVFLQPLPGASEESVEFAENAIGKFSDISAKIADMGAENIMKSLGAKGWKEREARFLCRCSRKKAADAVLALGRADAYALLEERGEIEVRCDDCNTNYTFGREDLAEIFRGKEAL